MRPMRLEFDHRPLVWGEVLSRVGASRPQWATEWRLQSGSGRFVVLRFQVRPRVLPPLAPARPQFQLSGVPVMAPEQLQGSPITGRTDQFALAGLAYTLLTGHKPFQAETLASLLTKILHQYPAPRTGSYSLT